MFNTLPLNSLQRQLRDRTDPLLPEKRVRVRMRLRDGHPGTAVGNKPCYRAQADDAGWVEHICYVSELASMRAKLETAPESITKATAMYWRKLRVLATQYAPDGRGDDLRAAPNDLAVWPEWARKVEKRCSLSIEAEFHALEGRGMRALVEFVEGEELPPPATPEDEYKAQRATETAQLASMIAEGVTRALLAAGVVALPAPATAPAPVGKASKP